MLDNLTKKQKIIVIAIAGIVVIGIMYFIYNKNQVKEDINIENERNNNQSPPTPYPDKEGKIKKNSNGAFNPLCACGLSHNGIYLN